MTYRLSTYVHAVEVDSKGVPTGRAENFGPNDTLPDWAVKAITNPDVWAGDPPPKADPPPAVRPDDEVTRLRARIAELEAANAADEPGKTDGAEKPSRSASRDDWAAYARTQGAPDTELAEREQGGLTRDELRDKYGA